MGFRKDSGKSVWYNIQLNAIELELNFERFFHSALYTL